VHTRRECKFLTMALSSTLLNSSALSILPCRTPNTSCRGFAHGRAWKSLRPSAAAAPGCRPSSVLVFAVAADSSSSAGAVTSPGVADRPLWLPGSTPPAYLDGTLVGDFGFDPLGLGEDPEALRWYVQAELIHARFAMAGVTGILFTDVCCSLAFCLCLPHVTSVSYLKHCLLEHQFTESTGLNHRVSRMLKCFHLLAL
jgi:hypothetical protein